MTAAPTRAAVPAAVDLVHLRHGQPMTTSRQVAARFGKAHKNVLSAIHRLLPDLPDDFGRLNFEPTEYTDDHNRQQPEFRLTQDGFLMLAMGFTGREAAQWRAQFIKAFNALSKAVQRQQRERLSPAWQSARAQVAAQHSAVNAVLVEVRRAAGKLTEPHHLANEARLIGYALTGTPAGLDRDTLAADQLRLLHLVEAQDLILLVQGASYDARKAALRALVLQAPGAEAGAVDDRCAPIALHRATGTPKTLTTIHATPTP
jgi:Rha family phage regulatory protein